VTFPDAFLEDLDSRTWRAPDGAPRAITTSAVFLGAGDHALEVAVATAAARPKADDMRKLWHARQGKRPSPVLLVVGYPEHGEARVSVCGPVGEQPPVIHGLEVSQVERVAAAALAEPTRHAAIRFLVAMLPEVGADLPGLRNSGLLATQELRNGVPARHDWQEACDRSRNVLPLRGRQLVEKLGFGIEQLSVTSSVLTVGGGGKRAVAVFLDEGETFDEPADRFSSTPVSHALALADREGVPWVVLTRARQIRLYAARPDTGVGRKGRAETFVEVDLALLPEDRAGYVGLLFSATALKENGTLDDILLQSADFAAELAIRLRERVYFEAVPNLATAVAARLDRDGALTEDDLAAAYEQTLIILFRLLFLAYAEDKDLLPYRTNSRYADHALKTIARRLTEDRVNDKVAFDAGAIDLWEDVRQLWRAVDKGNSGWGVPGYNGGLFSDKADVNPAGAALARIDLTDAEFGPALMALLVDQGPDDVIGPVDFRSLSVREFGTIYEGLLESMLSIAPADLTVDAKGNYVPTKKANDVVVHSGDIYFHNRSGARKATGSYFTKPFAVEHLLDHALEPALAEHITRLQALLDHGDEVAAAEAFFDFRCVDLAMGSGHFLVAAVDRIEARLSGFLALHPIAPVVAELERLRQAAVDALGDLADGVEIETTSLLRRQVARRCIYGVDLNHISVELARLAIWIHTFVPGLPLSFLDHSLVCGNSLTGIGTIDEAIEILDPGSAQTGHVSLFRAQIDAFLSRASDALRRLARITEATGADIAAAREAHREALAAVQPAHDLFDLLVLARLGEGPVPVTTDEDRLRDDKDLPRAQEAAASLQALHFPVTFPEVFLRDRAGFDCILGNPPWDKVLFEPQSFWVTRSPGLNALGASQRERAIEQLRRERPDDTAEEKREQEERERLQALVEAGYPNRGRGHYDFAKLFVERACGLLNGSATLGYVLPASSLLLGGWGKLRELLLARSDLTAAQARNKGGWLFEDVEHRTAVVLLTKVTSGTTEPQVEVWPGIASVKQLKSVSHPDALRLPRPVLASLSDSVVVPWLNEAAERDVFETIRAHPALAGGAGWVRGTHDARWDFRGSGPQNRFASREDKPGAWRVLMTRHVVPYGIDRGAAYQQFVTEPRALANGVENGPAGAVFGADHPLIIVRHPSRNDDSRTMIATALPLRGFIHNKGYVHAVRHVPGTDPQQLLALLGFLNTFTCDWWVRRFVDRHITAPVLNNVRLPNWTDAEITEAAILAGALLASRGTMELAGGVEVDVTDGGELDCIIRLEVLAASGFGLNRAELELMLGDFSDRPAACPAALRTAILGALT
jgi:hypothetical protein